MDCRRVVNKGLRVGLIAPPWVAVPPPVHGGTELVVDARLILPGWDHRPWRSRAPLQDHGLEEVLNLVR
jgi:hypothetical protein